MTTVKTETERRDTAIANLSTEHPESAGVYSEVKAMIPTEDLELLAARGFKDCSRGDDSGPKYYIRGVERSAMTVWTNDDGDDVLYSVRTELDFPAAYPTIEEAIKEACVNL